MATNNQNKSADHVLSLIARLKGRAPKCRLAFWSSCARLGAVANVLMLTKYIEAAMRGAHYELMENGRFFGAIPKCKGARAEGAGLEDCRGELRSVLEDWILLGLHLGHRLPVIDGINLNRKGARQPLYAQADQTP